jgi:hypothetical protein
MLVEEMGFDQPSMLAWGFKWILHSLREREHQRQSVLSYERGKMKESCRMIKIS